MWWGFIISTGYGEKKSSMRNDMSLLNIAGSGVFMTFTLVIHIKRVRSYFQSYELRI